MHLIGKPLASSVCAAETSYRSSCTSSFHYEMHLLSLFTCVLGSFLRFTWLLKHYSSCSSSSGSKINHRPVAQTCTCPTGARLSRQMDVGKPWMWFRKAILLEYLLSGSRLSKSTPKTCGFTSPKETCQWIVFPVVSWQLKLWWAEAHLKVSPAQFSFRGDRL